jgi:hypothetical protein
MIERSQNANTFFSIEGDFTHRSTRISKDGRTLIFLVLQFMISVVVHLIYPFLKCNQMSLKFVQLTVIHF